jgi:stage II sporulation protein D
MNREAIIATKITKRSFAAGVRSTPGPPSTAGARTLLGESSRADVGAFLGFVLFAIFVAGPTLRGARAQGDVTDADLMGVSAEQTVALGSLSGGAVAHVPLELYVARVLAGEAEPGAPDATMQALAVAIRTYAVFNAGRHGRDGFDLCDSTHCQVPRPSNAATRRAALATAGRILTYRGAPAEIFYSASCGGRSVSASEMWPRANLPYLRSVKDDVHDDDDEWTIAFTLDYLREALNRAGFEGSRLKDVEIAERTDSGRVARLELDGLRPDEIAGDRFRLVVGARQLQSTAFSIRRRGSTVTFTGRGYGHGVGMCVIGAGRRARRGETAAEILGHYYPGLDITRVASPEGTRLAARPAPAPVAVAAITQDVIVRVPASAAVTAAELEELARRAHGALARLIGHAVTPVAVVVHTSFDTFRSATDQPWWVGAVATGSTIDMSPALLPTQRDALEPALRTAMAEVFVAQELSERPRWVRIGAARFFARQVGPLGPPPPSSSRRLQCPTDAELRLAISVTAQREAEGRAEACFVRAYAETKDWRTVK